MVLALLPYSTLDLKSVSLYSAQIYADSISKSWNSIKALKRRLIAVCYWNVSDNDDNWVLKSQPIWVTQYVCSPRERLNGLSTSYIWVKNDLSKIFQKCGGKICLKKTLKLVKICPD